MANRIPFPLTMALTAILVVSQISPSWASRVLRVTAQDALEGRVALVVHAEGGGVILDFSPLGETIRKISLDDPSQIVYDSCLVNNRCGDQPNPTVRLFRSRGIRFPDLPKAKLTLLTIQTTDTAGEWRTYIFQIQAANGRSAYNKVLVGATTPNRPGAGLDATHRHLITLGMTAAEQRAMLVDPALKGRLQTFLQLLQGGVEPHLAARRVGISLQLVSKLQEMGQEVLRQEAAR